jgi:hypothetical protein
MKTIKIVAGLFLALAIAGCDESDAIKLKQANPVITNIGDIDGCAVKYVDRGYQSDSFFMAKCGDTTTQSNVYQVGKSTARMTSITQQINTLSAERDALAKQEDIRHEALSKLSPGEKEALGYSLTEKMPPQ